MAGVTSSIAIASNALVLLGHTTIASFEEGTAGATIAANLYEHSYLSLLSNHRWRFATKTQQLARLTETPLNDYKYAYQIPSDSLYVQQTTSSKYMMYENKIYSNDATLKIDYTYRVDEDKLPPYFSKALEFFLAAQFAVPLTGDMAKGDYYSKFYLDQIKKAKYADSTQYPQDMMVDSAYVAIRQ